jgi:DNA-binding response OmpR family regulator
MSLACLICGSKGKARRTVMSTFPRILLVDDDLLWLETLAEFLRRKGFVVLEAADAGRALEILANDDITVVISDYKLPGMDGLHLLRRIRQSRRKIAVVMVSSEDEPTLPQSALSAGAQAFVAKTAVPGQLLRKVRQVINTLLVKELAAPTVQLWQRLLPNPHRHGKDERERSSNTSKKTRKAPA